MDNQEREDLSRIRHYKGTVKDFKNYWDEMAGVETNAFGTPEYQGFNDVHPTRGDNQSPHWKDVNEGQKLKNGDEYLGSSGSKNVHYVKDAKTGKTVRHTENAMAQLYGSDWKDGIDVNEDIDLGHTDNEPGMLANDLSVIERYARELGEMMKELEMQGEVDFPHWWQSKIILAKEYLVKAKHYLRAELEK
jgi:hypothetical protein